MNRFEELKKKIKSKYPDFNDLPFFTRLYLKLFDYPSICRDSFEDIDGKWTMNYKIYWYKGKFYFYEFGGAK